MPTNQDLEEKLGQPSLQYWGAFRERIRIRRRKRCAAKAALGASPSLARAVCCPQQQNSPKHENRAPPAAGMSPREHQPPACTAAVGSKGTSTAKSRTGGFWKKPLWTSPRPWPRSRRGLRTQRGCITAPFPAGYQNRISPPSTAAPCSAPPLAGSTTLTHRTNSLHVQSVNCPAFCH